MPELFYRLSILDNVETSGSEEILDTSDEETDDDSDDEEFERKNKKMIKKPIKKTAVIRNPATLEELEEVTEQVLKVIFIICTFRRLKYISTVYFNSLYKFLFFILGHNEMVRRSSEIF